MKKIKDILKETKEKTLFHVKHFSSFIEKHKILRLIIAVSLITTFGLAIKLLTAKKETETAEASEFQSNGGYIALNSNPCWYYGFSLGNSYPDVGTLPYNYISTITNRGYVPSNIEIYTNVKQISPINMLFNNNISYFCQQINANNTRPNFNYGDNFTERFLPKVYPITELTNCRNTVETQAGNVSGTTINNYVSEFYYAQTPFYDYYDIYWANKPNSNNTFKNYIGFFTIYEAEFDWDTTTVFNHYRITYPEYTFYQIIPNSCVIDYSNYNPNTNEYSLSTITVSTISETIFKYIISYNNGLKFTFNIMSAYYGNEVTVQAKAFGNNRFTATVPVRQGGTIGSELILGFTDHTDLISENNAVIFNNGYDQGYAKALSDYSAIEQRNIDNAVKEAVENYNNNIYVDSKSFSAGYTTGEQHADNRINKDSASYQAGLTAGADIAGLTPFQFIVNSVNTFLNTPLFSINGWTFTLSYLIYISFGLLLIGILIKTFWGG